MVKILDNFKRQQIIGILATGGSRVLAAQYVGCHPRTIYNEAKADPDFAAELNRTETAAEHALLHTVIKAGNTGVLHAAKWALERIYPDRYRLRQPKTLPRDCIKQFLEELTLRLADNAPSEEERSRILEVSAAFAKELTEGNPLWDETVLPPLDHPAGLMGDLLPASRQPTATVPETPSVPIESPSTSPDQTSPSGPATIAEVSHDSERQKIRSDAL